MYAQMRELYSFGALLTQLCFYYIIQISEHYASKIEN